MEIRMIFAHDVEAAYPVVAELRPHLDLEEFLYRFQQQADAGYELWGAYEGRELVGAIGHRSVTSLAWGAYLHVDDLVVTEKRRTSGVGRALLEHAEELARKRGLPSVYLESRSTALGFYTRLGYAQHPSPIVHKKV